MSENKHTAGPWTFYSDDEMIADDRGDTIAEMFFSEVGHEAKEANGKLIAAAPDLLKCCRSVLEIYGNTLNSVARDSIDSAIRKAGSKPISEEL